MTPASPERRAKRDRNWPPFQPTEKKPGEWEQTRFGFRRLS